jgi:hypothetical protein
MLLAGQQELSVVIVFRDCIGVPQRHCLSNYRLFSQRRQNNGEVLLGSGALSDKPR